MPFGVQFKKKIQRNFGLFRFWFCFAYSSYTDSVICNIDANCRQIRSICNSIAENFIQIDYLFCSAFDVYSQSATQSFMNSHDFVSCENHTRDFNRRTACMRTCCVAYVFDEGGQWFESTSLVGYTESIDFK